MVLCISISMSMFTFQYVEREDRICLTINTYYYRHEYYD